MQQVRAANVGRLEIMTKIVQICRTILLAFTVDEC